VEEEMSIIFHLATGCAVMVNVNRVPDCSFHSCKCPPDQSLGECLDEWREILRFPRSLQNVISLRENTSGAMWWEIDDVLGGQVPVNAFGSTNSIFRWLPSKHVLLVLRDKLNCSDFLYCLIIKGVS
jgi:hypothetical protein